MKSFYLVLILLLAVSAFGQVTSRKTFPYMDSGTAAQLPVTCPVPSLYLATDTGSLYVCNANVFVPITAAGGGFVSLSPSLDQTVEGNHFLFLNGGTIYVDILSNLTGFDAAVTGYAVPTVSAGIAQERNVGHYAGYGWAGVNPVAGINANGYFAQALVSGGGAGGNLVGFLDFQPNIAAGTAITTYLAFYCDHASISNTKVTGAHACFSGYTGAGGWGGDFFGGTGGGSVALSTGRICHSTDAIANGGTATDCWYSGTGTPEGAVTAHIGSFYSRLDGGAGTSFYVKESGTGNTGWVGK